MASNIKQLNNPRHSNNRFYSTEGDSPALNQMGGGLRQPKILCFDDCDRYTKGKLGPRIKKDGDMFTLNNMEQRGIIIPEATKQGYAIAQEGDSINLGQPNSKTRRGRVGG